MVIRRLCLVNIIFIFCIPHSTVFSEESNQVTNSYKYIKQSDPLGQQPRLIGSIPKSGNVDYELSNNIDNNIIMIIQLILRQEHYYDGNINGALNEDTEKAIISYKNHNLLLNDELLDAETLESFGII